MFRLFISLFLMVLFSFVLFIALGTSLDSLSNNVGANADIEEKVTTGTLNLLDKSVEDLGTDERNVLIKDYQAVFGEDFNLVTLESLDLSQEEQNTLRENKLLIIEDKTIAVKSTSKSDTTTEKDEEENTIELIYRKYLDTDLVWRINLDIDVDLSLHNFDASLKVSGGRFADGMFYLLEQALEKSSPNNISEELSKIQPNYGLALSFIDNINSTNIFKNKAELKTLFEQKKVINITQNSNYVTFIHAFPDDSSALQIGPVEIPWIVRNLHFLIIFLLIFSMSTALFLWLWPLWSNLLKIKKAATEFGEGNYHSRINYRKSAATATITAAFNDMAERTQQSITTQKELTNAVSHELRTPVARMRFAIEMLEQSDSKEDKSRYIESLNQDIEDLDELLDELLSYARFDQYISQAGSEKNTQFEFRLEKLTPWLSSSMDKLMPLAAKQLLNYQIIGIGINESAYLEPRLMTRVLDNLVQNALRYSNNTVEVTLSKDAQHYVLSVDDDGVGINKADRKHIFDAFSRIDTSRDRSTGGFGLGLAIADRIVKAHKGSIDIKDSKLGGACFEVRWPIKINT